ncbi:MAG TPA: glycoside hydrolase family 3 C-terminal domain-containing protein, partial [Rhizomicrobium sp.]
TLAGRRQLAREIASGSIVLLKNDREALPLSGGRLALIGPLADAAGEMRGCWSAAGIAADCVSVLAGLRFALPHQSIRYADGVDIESGDESRIAAAAALCDDADTIVLCLGEAANMNGEACSRAHPGLPGKQAALVDTVLARAAGKKVIAILFSGRPLVVPELATRVDALVAAWAPGSEAGNALADILTGHAAPSGRTPVSWPRAVGQIPLYFGERPSGRPANLADHYTSKYLDEDNVPLFPFGHGLSYGEIVYSNLAITPAVAHVDDSFSIAVTLTNRGARAATETVFLFVRDKVASVTRPLLELKDFQRKPLQPGESTTVRFTLPANALKFLDAKMRSIFEPGEIEILAGPSSDRSRLLAQTVRIS